MAVVQVNGTSVFRPLADDVLIGKIRVCFALDGGRYDQSILLPIEASADYPLQDTRGLSHNFFFELHVAPLGGRDACPTLRAAHPRVGVERQGRADRYLPGPPDHATARSRDRQSVLHRHRRQHRNGPSTFGLAPVKKTIYSLTDLRDILFGCNRRYLDHLSSIEDIAAGIKVLDRLTRSRRCDGKTVNGINFFDRFETTVLRALQNPRVNIAGIRRADLAALFKNVPPDRLSRRLRRLRDLGIIKRVAGTYRYYLTKIGRAAIAAACHLTQATIIPALA
jgi:hypothetical protein